MTAPKSERKGNAKLFTVGPAQMYPHTLEVRGRVVPYFRTPEFSAMMQENREMMLRLTSDHLTAFDAKDYTGLLVNLHET